VATDAANGRELWLSDGTMVGTRAVSAFAAADADPQNVVAVSADQFFFT
jgi:ELWxxDGT repeat protein